MNISNIQRFAYRFFDAVVIINKNKNNMADRSIFKEYTPNFIVQDFNKFDKKSLLETIKVLNNILIDNEKANKTFYKTWNKILNSSRFEIFIDQIIHYYSTYGCGFTGDDVYLPDRDVDIDLPEIENIKIIKSITIDDFKEKFGEIITSNIALSKNDITNIILILNDLFTFDETSYLINSCDNKEIKILLCDKIGVLPENPEDFLRYLIYIASEKKTTLLIKDENIKYLLMLNGKLIGSYLNSYDLNKLASIFNRYKDLFICIKKGGAPDTKRIINKISKLSKTKHLPYKKPDYLTLTEKQYSISKFKNIISNLDTSYLIKIYQALNYRKLAIEGGVSNFIFAIRNGKYYMIDRKIPFDVEYYVDRLDTIKNIISNKIINNMINNNIILCNNDKFNIVYPVSGKQFIGNMPIGSYIDLSNNPEFIVGIYWENVVYDGNNEMRQRVDLDLSFTSKGSKVGWNADFVSGGNNIVYSGDMTDAKNGAAELLLFNNKSNNILGTVNVNFYNFHGYKTRYIFFITSANGQKIKTLKKKVIQQGGMVDVNKLIYQDYYMFLLAH